MGSRKHWVVSYDLYKRLQTITGALEKLGYSHANALAATDAMIVGMKTWTSIPNDSALLHGALEYLLQQGKCPAAPRPTADAAERASAKRTLLDARDELTAEDWCELQDAAPMVARAWIILDVQRANGGRSIIRTRGTLNRLKITAYVAEDESGGGWKADTSGYLILGHPNDKVTNHPTMEEAMEAADERLAACGILLVGGIYKKGST